MLKTRNVVSHLGGWDMQETRDDLVGELLSMPLSEVREFVRTSVRTRRLRQVISRLNHDVLSDNYRKSKAAEAALKKMGFTD